MFDDRFGRSGRRRRLAPLLPAARFIACDDIVARGCQDDPDACCPGDVFVVRTTSADAQSRVRRALARGVVGIVADGMIATQGRPLCIVPDAAWAFARLTQAFAGEPARMLRVIAITGSSGKTTAAWLTASVLSEGGVQVGVLSDLGCLDGTSSVPERAVYARPRQFASWLARLARSGCTHAVVEVSSRMLARHLLAGVPCDTVVVTNLAAPDGDQAGGSAPAAPELRILDAIAADGCLIAPTGTGPLGRLRRHARRRGIAVVSAGLAPGGAVTATPLDRSLYGQTFLLRARDESVPVAVDAPLTSFVRNALLAAAVGGRAGVPLERIARGLEAAGSVAGRMERIDRGQDVPAFIDAPTTLRAASATLACLRRLTRGRLVAIAEERWTRAVGLGTDTAWLDRRCDASLVVPTTMMTDSADDADIAAYARIDRLLDGLGADDCLIVLGGPGLPSGGPPGPDDGEFALVDVIDGWFQLAHPPGSAGRQAA
jgi:UDP-N-acetylmuramoyl-L-alanyl-D-glutamate--2,6-diaminopimelate ligase